MPPSSAVPATSAAVTTAFAVATPAAVPASLVLVLRCGRISDRHRQHGCSSDEQL